MNLGAVRRVTSCMHTATNEEVYNVQTVNKLCMLCNDCSPHSFCP